MGYRDWRYDERATRDSAGAQTWSAHSDTADTGGYDRWFGPPGRAHRDDEDFTGAGEYPLPRRTNGHYPDSDYSTGEWTYGERTDSWPADDGWLPRQGSAPPAADLPHPAPPPPPSWYDPGRYQPEGGYGYDVGSVPRQPSAGYDNGEPTGYGDWRRQQRYPAFPAQRMPGDLPHPPTALPDLDDEDDEEPEHGFLAALLMTIVWYVVPIAVYVAWALLLGGQPVPNCLDDAGNPCPAPREDALATLMDSATRLAVALGFSLAVAVIIRWITGAWRAVTVGFAAAVVGAGIATVIFSVLARTAGA